MKKWKMPLTALLFALVGAVIGSALSAAIAAPPLNQFGVIAAPGISWTTGSCVVIGAPFGNNTFVLAPTPCPTAPALTIGMAVQGGSPGAMLATDANTKLTLVNGLLAQ